MLRRVSRNPLLTREDLPDIPPAFVDASSVFNPGAVMVDGRTLLMLRIQSRGRETGLLRAWSDDHESFTIDAEPVAIRGLDQIRGTVHHVYDPRLTLVDGELLAVLAVEVDVGCRLAVARLDARHDCEIIATPAEVDTRNGVLFPERFGGRYLRLERPNDVALDGGPTTGDTVVLSESDNLATWRTVAPVMSGRPHGWDELLGPGPPPIKTYAGWLLVYHGVATHFQSSNIYQAGAVLLDLNDPSRVMARTRRNILEPRTSWELTGQVPNVVFPSGMTVDRLDDDGFAPDNATVRVYYGAADTCVGLASASVGELVNACRDRETP